MLNGVRAVFHEPHPEREIGKGMVRSLREFLGNAGIGPDEDENEDEAKGEGEREA
ncbi:MAG: type II toxin-antitoxin system HicA family toxin [Planctomycetaceae bacterium]|nr:type II toxin-antitoxin system HicA family toxin [Planctomycetaceae bacterium]